MDLSPNAVYLQDILEWVNTNQFTINLTPDRIGFLLAIYSFQRTSKDELTEEGLLDLYRQVLAYNNDAELTDNTLAARANKMINDFVLQKLLNRFNFDFGDGNSTDDSDSSQSAVYRLSPLAIGIAENYFRQKEFSQVGLSKQLATVAKEMHDITSCLDTVGDAQHWYVQVYAPLRYSVAEIFDLIDYRQRELDEEQHQIKLRIQELLTKDWHAAIDACEQLLSSTGHTLRELQDTLTSAGHKLQSQLIQIYHAVNLQLQAIDTMHRLVAEPELRDTRYSDNPKLLQLIDELQATLDAEARDELRQILHHLNELTGHLQTKLDRIMSWGQQSIDLWIGFDKHIHRFIRNTIDLDKNRVFSTRLRRSTTEFLDHPFFLTYAHQERILDLRDEAMALVEGEELGELPDEIPYETYDNIQEKIALAMQNLLEPFSRKHAPLDIATILRNILRDNPLAMHFDMARIFVEQAMKLGVSSYELEGVQAAWQTVNSENAQIQANIINTYPSKSSS